MKKYYNPFASYIYFDNESKIQSHDMLIKWVDTVYNSSPFKDKGNFYGNGFTTYFYEDFTGNLNKFIEFNELSKLILEKSAEYLNEIIKMNNDGAGMNIDIDKEIEISNMWFNVNPKGGHQGKHHHAKNLLGGTYYLQVPDDSGDIQFSNPNPLSYYMNQKPYDIHMITPSINFKPTAGDLLIWPGWMDHEISMNKTDEKRITISFGINFKGETIL